MIIDRSAALGPRPVVMEEATDPEELARAQVRRAQFDRNWSWLQAHGPAVYEANRGKVICISGEELFSADSPEEALALARAAHPEDEGRFTLFVPREKMVRIYALQRRMVSGQ